MFKSIVFYVCTTIIYAKKALKQRIRLPAVLSVTKDKKER